MDRENQSSQATSPGAALPGLTPEPVKKLYCKTFRDLKVLVSWPQRMGDRAINQAYKQGLRVGSRHLAMPKELVAEGTIVIGMSA